MAFRLTHIHDYHRFIAIDLGLYRVKAGIYDVSEGWLTCAGFSSVRQSRKNFVNGNIVDIGWVWQTIEQAILQAGSQLETIPDDIIMSFPSQSFVSDSITTQYTREDPDSLLTMSEVDNMIKRIEKNSYERARIKSETQFWIIHDDLKLISSTIISIQIDGKVVSSPIGFSGWRVRLTVLNVFVPSGEFNIMRSIVSQLGKRVISLIPQPLILPKIVENTHVISDSTCLIDIGYEHTTVTVIHQNEIVWFDSFSYGTSILMESISYSHPHYSLLQIENLICNPEEFLLGINREDLDEFLSYIQDAIFGYLQSEHIDLRFKRVLFHGNIFENTTIMKVFSEWIEGVLGYEIKKNKLSDVLDIKLKHEQCTTYGLALMAKELLHIKKDPLVRILRYVLYQYE
jgi:hypothetical protein